MVETFRIYKGDSIVKEGPSPLTITGEEANKSVVAGEYKATRVKKEQESERIPIPAFKTLPIAVTGVTLDKAAVTVDVGGTTKLTATIAPSNATNKAVTFSTSDAAVATVDNAGSVTGVKDGTAKITVKTTDGNKTAECTVTVKMPVVAVTGVTLSPKTSTAVAGTAGNRQLSATVTPANATNKTVTYSIAPATTGLAVTSGGNITWTDAVPAGEYTTTGKTADGNKTDTHVLTLTEPEEG